MMEIITPLLYAVVFVLLGALAVYDHKYYILPNKLNGALALAFLALHAATGWDIVSPLEAAAGALAGGGLLLTVRSAANWHYKTDAVGLGDVKLMTAAGFGLGFPDIMLALSVGALLGLMHGMVLAWYGKKQGDTTPLARVNVPAGVGLAAGTAIIVILHSGWIS